MPQTFCSYLRVSTDRQGELGLGIEAQREAVRRHVESVGGILLEEYVEVETGKSCTRPILLKLIARCRQGRATLLIARLDRLARSVSFISSLMDSGVDFVAADMPAANRLMLHMMAAFAEFERDQIAARTKAALAAAKERGVVLGANGRLLAERNRAAALARAETLRPAIEAALADGAETLKDIAVRLNDAGVRTVEGSSWGSSAVQKVMTRLGLQTQQSRRSDHNRIAALQ